MTRADVTRDELAARLGDPGLTVVDVRSRAEYEGARGAPCCPRQGRIPGAVHLDVAELSQLDATAIRERLGPPDGVAVVAYCHSGSRSAVAAQMLRAAGYDARNYAGSWHEWSRDATLPIELE